MLQGSIDTGAARRETEEQCALQVDLVAGRFS